MEKNTTLFFMLLALVCYSKQSSGQDLVETQSKNAIYANAGTLGLWFTASVNYERHLFSTDNKFHVNYYLRTCAGVYETWGADGPYGSLGLQGIFGAEKNHLELGLGLGVLYDKSGYEIGVSNANYFTEPNPPRGDYTDWVPAVSVGYRYQKPSGGFVFRTGIGFPDGVYLSLGLAF